MDYQQLTYGTEGAAAVITLNRPERMNALTKVLEAELRAAMERAGRDPEVRAIMLTGAGRAFCAGADLRVVEELAPAAARWAEFMDLWHRVFDRIERLPPPVIAGVHGLALAGGLELTLVCDLVVADEGARLGDQHANFALVAGAGGSQRLPRLIGARRAKELMLLGGWLDARQAHDWGLVNRVVAPGTIETATLALARELAEKSGAASRTVKLLVDRGLGMDLRAGLELEKQQVAAHMRTEDATAGLRAFRERSRRKEEK
jgi:enoyl-CoA hydratase/carnithine racemase